MAPPGGPEPRMALLARIRRLTLVLTAVGALVAPVFAGERVTPTGGTDESGSRTRSVQPTDATAPPTLSSAHAPRTSITPLDDGYAPAARTTTPAPRGSELAPASPATRTGSGDAPARRRESATSISRTPPKPQPRAKVSMRNLPAAPGMGTLLRVGVTAGREISWLDFELPTAPTSRHSGRAPPRAPTLSNPAPAATPVAPLRAANLASALTSFAPRTLPLPTTILHDDARASAPRPSRAVSAPGLQSRDPLPARPGAPSGAGAERSESAPPPDPSVLSGGFQA